MQEAEVRSMKWRQLQAVGTQLGVYNLGMTKAGLMDAIIIKLAENEVAKEVSDTQSGEESPSEGIVGPSVQETAPVKEKMYVFEAIPDRDGKTIDLEVRINKSAYVGRTISVPEKHAGEVRRLLKEGRFLFSEAR